MNLDIRHDDVLHDITTYADTYFHTIFCDPPYGLGNEWVIGVDGRPIVKNKTKDFMGKWDGFDEYALEKFYAESFRVLKHGGFLVMFGLDRQLMPFNYYAKKAGFEILQSLHWFYASSMPKATDVPKMLDKRSDADTPKKSNRDLSKQFNGYKYSIAPFKQCSEQIMVFRKPSKISIIDDIINNEADCSPSCVNIEGTRVPVNPVLDAHQLRTMHRNQKTEENGWGMNQNHGEIATVVSEAGRYPSTVFVDETMAAVLDNQSGVTTSTVDINLSSKKTSSWFTSKEHHRISRGDTGGISRVLHTCNYDEMDYDLLNYNPKASGKEKNAGLCSKNPHPTVKPISLISKLATLWKLPIPDQKIYIPFGGVFSEVIGFHKAGFRDITVCELSEDYIKIGMGRFEKWCKE